MITNEYLRKTYKDLAELSEEDLTKFRDGMSTLAELALRWYIDNRRGSKSPSFGSCQSGEKRGTIEVGNK